MAEFKTGATDEDRRQAAIPNLERTRFLALRDDLREKLVQFLDVILNDRPILREGSFQQFVQLWI
jgi:hypothetical protein